MKKQLMLALALAVAPFAALAQDSLSYSYAEAGFAKTDVESGGEVEDIDPHGAYIRGSAEITPQWNLFGSHARVTGERRATRIGAIGTAGTDMELTRTEVGVGYHQSISNAADLLVEVAYHRTNVELEHKLNLGYFPGMPDYTSSDEIDISGGRVAVGVRGELAQNFEGWAKAGYVDGGDYDGSFVGNIGAQIKFNATWGIVGEFEFAEDNTNFLVGVRVSF